MHEPDAQPASWPLFVVGLFALFVALLSIEWIGDLCRVLGLCA